MASLADMQRDVDTIIHDLGGYWPPLANLARLFEECGELARDLNQNAGHKIKKPGEAPAHPGEELGDILFVVAVLANSLGVDLEQSFQEVLAKYRTRDTARTQEE